MLPALARQSASLFLAISVRRVRKDFDIKENENCCIDDGGALGRAAANFSGS
jgi:hypothetical protein